MDGIELPSDWYLRLTGEGTKMLRGEIPLTSTIPIVPFPDNAAFVSQDVPTMMAPGDHNLSKHFHGKYRDNQLEWG